MKKHSLVTALALAAMFGGSEMRREPIRMKDPAKDAERIAAAQAKRARKAARRTACQPPNQPARGETK